jgi:hypothetical protein
MAEDTGPNHARYESPIRKLIFESALIVFSILLALAANQWNDARKQRALVNRALASTVRRMWVYFVTVRTNEDTLLNRYDQALKLLGPPKKS